MRFTSAPGKRVRASEIVPAPSLNNLAGKVNLLRQESSEVITVRGTSRSSTRTKTVTHCVMAWSLSASQMEEITEEEILALHSYLASTVEFFQSDVIVDEAFCGVLVGRELEAESMSAADTAVRMGQLLCRWGKYQPRPVALYVSAHIGQVHELECTGAGGKALYGSAIAGAKYLCDSSAMTCVVHLSDAVRQNLTLFKHLRLMVVNDDERQSYYLDTDTRMTVFDEEALEEEIEAEDPNQPRLQTSQLAQVMQVFDEEEKKSFGSFVGLLLAHGVDLSLFGSGYFKSLEEFYSDIYQHKKSYLVVDKAGIQRVVELIRISLRFRDDSGTVRELRIKSEEVAGAKLQRDQPLAMVMTEKLQGQWRKALQLCFEDKLRVPVATQKAYFVIDDGGYTFSEETGGGKSSIPGIDSIYKTHNIVVLVKDKSIKDLRHLGLPKGSDFSTDTGIHGGADQLVKLWTWAPVTDNKELILVALLQKYSIDVSEWSWMAFAELYSEVFERSQSTLEERSGDLVRRLSIVKVNIFATVENRTLQLCLSSKRQKGYNQDTGRRQSLSMRALHGQGWEEAALQALRVKLGVNLDDKFEGIHVDTQSLQQTEVTAESNTFPGLTTMYVINEVTLFIVDHNDPRWNCIGLPDGIEFTFSRKEVLTLLGETDIVTTRWHWRRPNRSCVEV